MLPFLVLPSLNSTGLETFFFLLFLYCDNKYTTATTNIFHRGKKPEKEVGKQYIPESRHTFNSLKFMIF